MRWEPIIVVTLLLSGCDVESPLTVDLVIRGGSLIDSTGSSPRANSTIIVQNGLIQEVTSDIGVKG